MHDTHDIRKSKELHDKEMNLDLSEPKPTDFTDHKFRADLIQVLTRIAKSLEYIEGGLIQVLGRSIE